MKIKLFFLLALAGLMMFNSCKKEEDDPIVPGYNENGMWGYTPDLYSISVAVKGSTFEERYGFMDKTGQVVIVPVFHFVDRFYFDLARVTSEVDGNLICGYINKNGQVVIPYQYSVGGLFTSEGLAVVKDLTAKFGYIDRSGVQQIPCQYDHGGSFHEGLAPVRSGNLYGAINLSGTLVIPMIYDFCSIFNEGYARVKNAADKHGFIDKNNNLVVDYMYEDAEYFVNGLACVVAGGKSGFIRPDGSVAIPFSYDLAGSFWEDRAWVQVDELFGFIDKTGTYIATPQYTDAGDFAEGLAPVETGGLWGYIDASGTMVIQPQYEGAMGFQNGVAMVLFADLTYGYINRNLDVLWKSEGIGMQSLKSGSDDLTRDERRDRDAERIVSGRPY